MIMHVDGNSFYASCEAIFRPDLRGKPVAVLTNNDGIIIALNQKCKDLGFKRGDVYFKVRERCKKLGVEVFSSNYTLYSDISRRVNLIYSRYAPELEFYSIDESFLYFPDWSNADYSEIGRELRGTVLMETGVPVSVGIAPNKTLAKLCNKLAKKCGGVCEWSKIDQDSTLAKYPAGDIWGIGRSKAAFLAEHGVMTALDLKNCRPDWVKKHLTITGWRTARELNGFKEIERQEAEAHQSIIVSRSFSGAVIELDLIASALSEWAQEAVRRLRADRLVCRCVTVYLMTSRFAETGRYANSASIHLRKATSYLPEVLQSAVLLLRQIFRNGYKYKKVMICLTDLSPSKEGQEELFSDSTLKEKRERIMACLDSVNARYGRGTLTLGWNILYDKSRRENSAPVEMRRGFLSPCWTTNLADVPPVY